MSAPARLLALRVQGFKSFAERTLVEFGPGISAVVGPNGSGKSNLADALRWALGEQGRSLRIRRSEDVIWAGSEKRSAQGMADVTLVLDNADALLPVEYSVVELGRRLYRSGENDYLLNRQRVRLRDLVDLLDSANLAENAFLFIGQGMVDQALALRPEERRPLFEEVAGVRRHERRRRRAEEQLAEAEGNLARVEDILAELRPQARRLGQLAEQQATRRTAGEELAAALIAAAHGRWHEAAGRAAGAERARDAQRAETERALAELEAAESAVGEVAASMAARADLERDARAAYEAARVEVTALGLREARAAGELAGVARDRARLVDERAAAAAELEAQRRLLAGAVPEPDLELEAAAADADRALAEAIAELGGLRAATRARGEEAAALRRAEAARASEAETARRRHAEAVRQAADAGARAREADDRATGLAEGLEAARERLATAITVEAAATDARDRARTELDRLDGARRAAQDAAARAGSLLAAGAGRLEQIERRLAEDEARGIARAARAAGGRRVDEDLGIDPGLRPAVEAALGELARAYVVDEAGARTLAGERGLLVVRERIAGPDRPASGTAAELRRLDDAVATAGGGRLADSVRRDPNGAVRALLARVVWAPDADAVLAVQAALPPGWLVVTRAGDAVADGLTVRLGRGDTPLERRAEAERLAREVATLEHEGDGGGAPGRLCDGGGLGRPAGARCGPHDRGRGGGRPPAGRGRGARRRPGSRGGRPGGRLASRAGRSPRRRRGAAGGVGRGHGIGRRGPRAARTRERRASRRRSPPGRRGSPSFGRAGTGSPARPRSAIGSGARRRHGARAPRRPSRSANRGSPPRIARPRRSPTARSSRRRSATARSPSSPRHPRWRRGRGRRSRRCSPTTAPSACVSPRRNGPRRRRASGCGWPTTARGRRTSPRWRRASTWTGSGSRSWSSSPASARSGCATWSSRSVRCPAAASGRPSPRAAARETWANRRARPDDGATSAEGAVLEAALDRLAPAWVAEQPATEVPTAGRLAVLRRRFHELGAANPFAVDEFRALRERLDGLEAQHRDLRDAIARTRALIADLDDLIATQFRTTFAALEVAFDARFRQLFGGGFARLSLTDPADLAATGIEITARPPGKKPQALSMLSGGERALTAVALLFAMLEVRPAPFCVLDEVDAALDEANVGRFTDALRSLAEQTQFIVITHNRGTIEVADALYGVTVGDDSVSRVISLRLDEAQAIADTPRPEARAVLAGEPAG